MRQAVRAFFESNFSPYSVTAAADGSAVGLVTGYYEPLLAGSRLKSAKFGVPLYAPPDDLLTVDLSALHPELKNRRVRGRVDGKTVVPYWPRAEIERGAAPLYGKALVYVEDPDRGVLPGDPGFRTHRAGGRLGNPLELCRPERPSLSLDRSRADRSRRSGARTGVDARHRRVGQGQSRQAACAAGRKSELRVLSRSAGACRGLARRGDRRSDRLAGCRRCWRGARLRWTPAPFRSARRCSWRRPCRCRPHRSSGWCSRRTPVARFAAPCARISSGVSVRTRAAKPVACARTAACGCCGR